MILEYYQIEYTRREIRDLLLMIDVGNRPKQQQKRKGGLSRTVSAYGIVGKYFETYMILYIFDHADMVEAYKRVAY